MSYNKLTQASGYLINMANSGKRNAPINLRALESQRNLIDQAASLSGKNRSDFMLEAACREAENTLLNQRLLMVNEESFNTFTTLLDAPVKDNPALQKLMSRKAPWE